MVLISIYLKTSFPNEKVPGKFKNLFLAHCSWPVNLMMSLKLSAKSGNYNLIRIIFMKDSHLC